MTLVSLEAAKNHLRILDSDQDEDIEAKLQEATAIVIDYLKRPDHGWNEATAPFPVKAAIKLMIEELMVNRSTAQVTEGIKSLLWRLRDPALA